jgi:hypothetical protein
VCKNKKEEGYKYAVDEKYYQLGSVEQLKEDEELYLMQVVKYSKKKETTEVYNKNLEKLPADLLSNYNLLLVDVKREVLLWQTNKNGLSIKSFENFLFSGGKGIEVEFFLKLDEQKISEIEDIHKFTVTQRPELGLFPKETFENDLTPPFIKEMDYLSVTIKVTAKKYNPFPKSKIVNFFKHSSRNSDCKAFSMTDTNGIPYDFIKNKMQVKITLEAPNLEDYKKSIINAYKSKKDLLITAKKPKH